MFAYRNVQLENAAGMPSPVTGWSPSITLHKKEREDLIMTLFAGCIIGVIMLVSYMVDTRRRIKNLEDWVEYLAKELENE